MYPANSIEMAIWVAVGGRGTLIGAAGGALLVNGAKSWFTVSAPETWLYVLGAMFIIVTLFLPGGVASLWGRIRSVREQSARGADEEPAADGSQA